MEPAQPSMKEMLDYIQKGVEKATYRQTILIYGFIKALMKE